MAGIYIHVPYCKVACHYCNFHFSTNTAHLNDFVEALLLEISLQKRYLQYENIETIYFGGGTPSLLEQHHLTAILDTLHKNFTVTENIELTLEANPDDVSTEKISAWKSSGINRLSIGIQSFFNEDLKWMNRSHNAEQSFTALSLAREAGIDNVNIDLIYGVPNLTDDRWVENLETFSRLNIPHLSAYSLTVEKNTALDSMIRKGKKENTDDNVAAKHFSLLMNFMKAHDYEHYEISNFSKAGRYSKHNTAYWFGKKYLGLGPSAHSFNGSSRQWNVSNNIQYINSLLKENKLLFQQETLSEENRFNEQLMTGLRTMWGLNIKTLEDNFSETILLDFKNELQTYLVSGDLILENGILMLTTKGKFIADRIISDLMIINE
jgi:oxygen-independent coproporphyrinogen-3 oxidase